MKPKTISIAAAALASGLHARYGNLARLGRVMRIIKNSQTGGLLRLGVDDATGCPKVT